MLSRTFSPSVKRNPIIDVLYRCKDVEKSGTGFKRMNFLCTKEGIQYAFIMKYAEQNGYNVSGLARECYIDGIWNKESVEDWLTEI